MSKEAVHDPTELKIYGNKNPAVQYASDHSLRLHPAQQKLIDVTLAHPMAIMLGSADQINFLQFICRAVAAKKTLDIGVYTGYSSLSVALALPDDGKVVALDINDDYAKIGKPFWKEAGVEHKIDLVIGPALETLQGLLDKGEGETFDFAFIDADKVNYDNYYELTLKLLRKNGVVALDNLLWGGNVYNPEINDASTNALRALADKIHKDERVTVSFLALGDGTLLASKN
jgi:predicted O-methyltransferase YrrM